MSKYNHAYTIAFSLDSDEEDPYKVPAGELKDAILKRAQDIAWSADSEIPEIVDCYSTDETYHKQPFEQLIDREEDLRREDERLQAWAKALEEEGR